MEQKPMNFIIFFPDEMRADALPCYGAPVTQAPHYDRLCAEGVTFEQCHAQNPVCSPSRCTLATGRYPHCDGHRSLWNLLKEHEANLFRYLKEGGYDVRIFGKNDLFSSQAAPLSCTEMRLGTDSFPAPIRPIQKFGQPGCYNFLYEPVPGRVEDTADWKSVERGVQFLHSRRKDDKPFFLFLPLMYPHCPYTVPEPYYSMYLDQKEKFALRPPCQGKPAYHELIRRYRQTDSDSCRTIRAIYAGMISFTDSLLGRIMDVVEECGLGDSTTLIAASDHGDYAGDYGLVEKWPNGCEDVLTHVPLIIRTPGGKAGHRVSTCTELFDVMPTVLELAGIPVRERIFARSLVPQLWGEVGDASRTVYCEGGYGTGESQCSEGVDKPETIWMQDPSNIYYPKYRQQKEHPASVDRAVMARNSHYKLVRRASGEHEFYDLVADPGELHNLYGNDRYTKVCRQMEQQMLDWYLRTADTAPIQSDARITEDILTPPP